jgi:hypothetical protein
MSAPTSTRTTTSAPENTATPPIRSPRGAPPGERRDDVGRLVDRVADEGPAGWRAASAVRLAAAVLAAPDRLSPAEVARLDAVLPALLEAAADDDAPALTALVAALGARLSPAVAPALRTLAHSATPRVAVAAHVASLLVAGHVPSAQHLADLLAVAAADPATLADAEDRPGAVRAATLPYALAVAAG